jgi:predicted house-cleaning noncanonical NTP pyrophosphatase (MazG superfamily)
MMQDVAFCPECNVPETFTQGQAWLNNGDIVQSVYEAARVAFVECENLDPLFRNVGDIIGVSIEHLVENIATRGNKAYLNRVIPKGTREMVRTKQLEVMPLIETITSLAQLYGFAKYELLDLRYEKDMNDFLRHRILEPFSLPLTTGAYAGAVSTGVGGAIAVSCEEISPTEYIYTAHRTEYPDAYKEKMQLREYRHIDGAIELERCGNCGGPKAYADYQWFPDRGLIRHRQTHRRMVLLGPGLLDPIFEALQEELDETIPQVVVEAQRRFVRTGFCPIDILDSEDYLRQQLALRGLGNLKEIRVDRKGTRMRVANACLHLLLVGLVQGTYELLFDVDTNVRWELSEEGELELAITPRTIGRI